MCAEKQQVASTRHDEADEKVVAVEQDEVGIYIYIPAMQWYTTII